MKLLCCILVWYKYVANLRSPYYRGSIFCNNLVNYKYTTCSLLCFLYTCWMCLIQIWQKYIRSSSIGKHNFGLFFMFCVSTFYLLLFFVFLEGRAGGGMLTFYLLPIDDFWNSVLLSNIYVCKITSCKVM